MSPTGESLSGPSSLPRWMHTGLVSCLSPAWTVGLKLTVQQNHPSKCVSQILIHWVQGRAQEFAFLASTSSQTWLHIRNTGGRLKNLLLPRSHPDWLKSEPLHGRGREVRLCWPKHTGFLMIIISFPDYFPFIIIYFSRWGFPCGSAGKESSCNAGDLGSIPRLGRSPGEGKGYLLQYSGLENSMDYGLQRVRHNWATFTFTFPSLPRWIQV